MTTSGTVAQTQIDVVTLIEHAVRRCGVPASVITEEILDSARDNLFLILSELMTRGLSLWCVKKQVYPVVASQAAYLLTAGTEDILKSLWRSGTALAQTSSTTSVATLVSTTAVAVNSTTVTVPAGAFSLALESSADGVTWQQVGSATGTAPTGGQRVCIDSDPTATVGWWRVRETVASSTISATFLTVASELMMAPLNRDQYTALPNKLATTSKSLQYWYDKQYQQPRLVLWPVSSDTTAQLVVWVQRTIQDVGDLTATLEVPQRWQNAVIYLLAKVLCLELPAAMLPQGRYEALVAQADRALLQAEDSERDGAPIRWRPNISGYTR